jgi:hypothetical protein
MKRKKRLFLPSTFFLPFLYCGALWTSRRIASPACQSKNSQRQPSAGDVYLKLTVIDDVLIVSFKEL